MLLLIIPINVAEAAEESGWDFADGWFDKNPGKFTAPAEIYDNNLETGLWGPVNGSITIDFDEPITGVLGLYVWCQGGSASGIRFITADNQETTWGCGMTGYTAYKIVDPVIRIEIFATNYNQVFLYEFDIFNETAKEPVENLKVIKKDFKNVDVGWDFPSDAKEASIYLDGKLIAKTPTTTYKISNLQPNQEYVIGVSAVYENGESKTTDLTVKTNGIPEITGDFVEVKNLLQNSATLRFKVSELSVPPQKILLQYDGKNEVVSIYSHADMERVLNNLKIDTEYTVKVQLDYGDGFLTNEIAVDFHTLPPTKEVIDLKAKPTAQSVSLEWKMPTYSQLDFARIYRKKENEGAFQTMTAFFSMGDGYDPLFETNGTTFKDLTVSSDTEYTYKVTTVDQLGNETTGVTVKAKTPKMSVGGGGVETDENDDFVITWETPTTGKIKVLVGDQEYTTVQATDKKITIPKNAMKFDLLGKPDVKLIPIDENGNEGLPTKPGGSSSGGLGDVVGGGIAAADLNANNLLKISVGLLAAVGGFILLALAFRVVPKLVRMIKGAFEAKRNSDNVGRRIN